MVRVHTRRDILAYGVALAGTACGLSMPTRYYDVSAEAVKTFDGGYLFPYRASIGNSFYDSKNGTAFLKGIPEGTRTLAIDNIPSVNGAPASSSVRIRRERAEYIGGDKPVIEIGVDVISRQFDVNHYRKICMGIDVSDSVNGGTSARLGVDEKGDIIEPRIILVKNRNADNLYKYFREALNVFSTATQYLIERSILPPDFPESEPHDPPEGSIVCLFDSDDFRLGEVEKSNQYIKKVRIHAPANGTGNISMIRNLYCRAIGLDVDLQQNGVTQRDGECGRLKYKRRAGHVLSNSADKD